MNNKLIISAVLITVIFSILGLSAFTNNQLCNQYDIEQEISLIDYNKPEYSSFDRQVKSDTEFLIKNQVDYMQQQGVAGKNSDEIRNNLTEEINSKYSDIKSEKIRKFNQFNEDLLKIIENGRICNSEKVSVSSKGDIEISREMVNLPNGSKKSAKVLEVGNKSFNPYRKNDGNLNINLGSKTIKEKKFEQIYFNLSRDENQLRELLANRVEEKSDSEKAVMIGVKDSGTLPYVQSSVNYWQNNEEYMEWNPLLAAVEYDEEMSDQEYETYDVIVVRNIDPCGEDALGCAPLVKGNKYVESPAKIYIKPNLGPITLEKTIRHELGHLFGLEHGEGPGNLMKPKIHIKRIPK